VFAHAPIEGPDGPSSHLNCSRLWITLLNPFNQCASIIPSSVMLSSQLAYLHKSATTKIHVRFPRPISIRVPARAPEWRN